MDKFNAQPDSGFSVVIRIVNNNNNIKNQQKKLIQVLTLK